jgi:DNA polymerase III epsilon subunit-like protein
MFTDVMLDLETMGSTSNSAIVSIGAVEFNIETGETGREFYRVVNLKSCLDFGLKIDASTVYWWLQQSQDARDAICDKNNDEIQNVLHEFSLWMNDSIQDIQIWGNGSRFDIGILSDAYIACKLKIPWNYTKERDVRTLVAFAPQIKYDEIANNNTLIHHPINDAKLQIKYCTKIYNKLNIQ